MKIRTSSTLCAVSFALAASMASAAQTVESPNAQTVDGPNVQWNLSTWGKKRAFTAGIEKAAELVRERTGGKFNIKIHYGEALSKSRENLDGIKLGALQGATFCNFYHPGKNPSWMVLTMPFLSLGNWQVSKQVREATINHPALVADMERWGAMPYMSGLLPQYEFMGKGKPPQNLADWKGMRVRAGGGIGLAMEKLGATRTTVPATEVYTSMERGTVEAASFPSTYAHASFRTSDIADWFTSNMSPGTTECATVLSKKAFNKLPTQYQDLLIEVKEEAYQSQILAYQTHDKKNLPAFRKKLIEVTYSPTQLAELQQIAGKPVWEAWVVENQSKFDARGLLDFVLSEIDKAQNRLADR